MKGDAQIKITNMVVSKATKRRADFSIAQKSFENVGDFKNEEGVLD
jgi:hypothetical protein